MTMWSTYSPEDNKLRLYSSSRLDKETYQRVHDAGFRWAPKQELFVAPMWTPSREDLLISLCGEVGDEDTSLTDRAEDRAERFEDYSDNRMKDADAAHAAVHRITDNIPLGQPILCGHHSERHARRDAEKIDRGMRKAVANWKAAEYWKSRAAGAIRHAKYKERPDVRARRIKGIEAEIRQYRARYTPSSKQVILQEPWGKNDGVKVPHVFCAPRGGRGGSWVPVDALPKLEKYYSRWIAHCELRLEYERAMLEDSGASDLLKPKPRPEQLPLCNYRAAQGLDIENIYHRGEIIHYPQVEMLQAEYADIDTDYKGTRVVGHSHRVRTAMIKRSLVCVFLTDSKVHTPPAPIEPKPPDGPKVQPIRLQQPEEPDAQAEKFEAMAETIKAGGVKVIAVPQLFPTPPELAARMVELADIQPGQSVLEPSAGTGNLLLAIKKHHHGTITLTAVEVNPRLASVLNHVINAADHVRQADFLECNGDLGYFDRIVMNPPFENGADIKHITHALTMLKPGGRLVAICANGPRQREALQKLAEDSGTWEELPEGTFKQSGTGVNTVLLTINKEPELHQPQTFGGDTLSLFPMEDQ